MLPSNQLGHNQDRDTSQLSNRFFLFRPYLICELWTLVMCTPTPFFPRKDLDFWHVVTCHLAFCNVRKTVQLDKLRCRSAGGSGSVFCFNHCLISVLFLRLQARPQVHTSAPFRAALFSCWYFLSPSPTRSDKSMREEIKSIGKWTEKVLLIGIPRSLKIFHEHRHCVKFLPGIERGAWSKRDFKSTQRMLLDNKDWKRCVFLPQVLKSCQLTFPQHRWILQAGISTAVQSRSNCVSSFRTDSSSFRKTNLRWSQQEKGWSGMNVSGGFKEAAQVAHTWEMKTRHLATMPSLPTMFRRGPNHLSNPLHSLQ